MQINARNPDKIHYPLWEDVGKGWEWINQILLILPKPKPFCTSGTDLHIWNRCSSPNAVIWFFCLFVFVFLTLHVLICLISYPFQNTVLWAPKCPERSKLTWWVLAEDKQTWRELIDYLRPQSPPGCPTWVSPLALYVDSILRSRDAVNRMLSIELWGLNELWHVGTT